MSQQAGLAKRRSLTATTPEINEPAARPKVMRRPTQFFTLDEAVLQPLPLVHSEESVNLTATPTLPTSLTTRQNALAWQEDARFGVVMLTLVVAINIALMLWLPTLKNHHREASPPLITSDANMSTVQPDHRITAPVTLYSKSAPAAETAAEDASTEDASPLLAPPPLVHILGDGPQGTAP